MAVLCQLTDPVGYRVSEWNIVEDPADRAYWLGLFAEFGHRIESYLRDDGLAGENFDARWKAFLDEYAAGMTPFYEAADQGRYVGTIDLCRYRQAMLRKYGWPDPYLEIKRRENEIAAGLYPDVVKRIDECPASSRWEMLFGGLFAGNMFDLGCPETIEMYERGQVDFFATLDSIKPRPWFVDHADTLRARFESPASYRQALVFVDNAGSDIVLGVMPTARELARAGIRVVLAANTAPALNDITIDELAPLLQRLAQCDPILADLLANDRIATVASGGDTPLIDLADVSDECNAVAVKSDLVVLEGMGRAVESNWTEKFKCDVWRVAMLKDESVVRWQGANQFDPVCRFDPA